MDGAGSDGGEADSSGPRSLLERAGVIGAEVLGPDDPGNPVIPGAAAGPSVGPAVPASSTVPPDEADRWARVGASPTTARTLRRLGLDPDRVATAPVSADELVGWLWHGFAIDEIHAWLGHGSVRTAARLRDAGHAPGPRID